MNYPEHETKFKDKKIAILGLGIEGFSTAEFLCRWSANITLFDQKDIAPEVVASAEKLGEVVIGKDAFEKVANFDYVVRSPGVNPLTPAILKAKQEGAVITSQTQLFLEMCPCLTVGVTGTKGKGTTSTLIYEMLRKAEFDTYLGGNIGIPPLTFLDALTPESRVVLELSSFQLQDVTVSPNVAVVLMITSEHLDYHASVEEYIDAKRNILRFQKSDDFAVINRDYLPSLESDIYTDGIIYQVSRERPSTEEGSFIKDNAIWIRMKGTEWRIIDVSQIALLGNHNTENASAAAMAATLAGAAKEDIASVLHTFKGLEHRLELVREHNGVKYFNDSFSTTPETAIAAVEAFKEPLVLVLGGSSKNSDFTDLAKLIVNSENITTIIGIGDEWIRIKGAIEEEYLKIKKEKRAVYLEGAKDMKTVVQAASKVAIEGDLVLLSPGCASFGMFENYKDRGDQFKKEVNSL